MKTKKNYVYLPIEAYDRILKEIAAYEKISKKDPGATWVRVIVNPKKKAKKTK